jgi:hypothetical protein
MMEKMSKTIEVTIVMNKNRASRTNITAHINEINKMLADGGSFVLYSEKQLEDLRSMLCTGQSVLGIDKTFNNRLLVVALRYVSNVSCTENDRLPEKLI